MNKDLWKTQWLHVKDRILHMYHTEGAGGGHAPDLIKSGAFFKYFTFFQQYFDISIDSLVNTKLSISKLILRLVKNNKYCFIPIALLTLSLGTLNNP